MYAETSDETALHWQRDTGRGVVKLYESGATLAENMGVTISKMQASIEAHYQASLKTAEDLDEGPCLAYPSVKSRNDASGKTGSGKKFCHSVFSGADFAAQPYGAAIVIPFIY